MHLLWRYYTTLAECTFSNRTMRKPTCHLLHAKASHLRYSLRNRQWGGSVYVLQMFFFVFFCFFLLFRPSKNMRQPFAGMAEQIFMKLLHSGENVVCIAVPKCGLGPPINFWGAKNCTLHIAHLVVTPGEWLRITLLTGNHSELVCSLWHCAAMAVALKNHERTNEFILVVHAVLVCYCLYHERALTFWHLLSDTFVGLQSLLDSCAYQLHVCHVKFVM